ncbi:MAG: NAD-dependent epimerase/dehydratase family protein [Candidatus Bathyarchaeia archaeon]
MKIFVTGGAGFIGSQLVDRLIEQGHEVMVYDNLSFGREEFIRHHLNNPRFTFVNGELLDQSTVNKSLAGHDLVCHLAANPQAIEGTRRTRLDLEQNTLTTYNVLEGMRLNDLRNIIFTSSGTVYGDIPDLELNERYGPMLPISLYGASKLACEGLISAFSSLFGIRTWIFRFGNIIGPRATHGVIHDLLRKLTQDPSTLEVLGDGDQTKPYVYIDDCLDGVLHCFENAHEQINLFNLAPSSVTSVKTIVKTLLEKTGNQATKVNYTGGVKGGGGWPGDVPKVKLDATKAYKLGWKPKYSSDEAVRKTIDDLLTSNH